VSEERLVYWLGTEVRRETRLPYRDSAYATPLPAEIAEVVRQMKMTGSEVGKLVGCSPQRVREWIGGKREMPYSVWRLLLITAGLALEGTAG
jgi:hypothetical protein